MTDKELLIAYINGLNDIKLKNDFTDEQMNSYKIGFMDGCRYQREVVENNVKSTVNTWINSKDKLPEKKGRLLIISNGFENDTTPECFMGHWDGCFVVNNGGVPYVRKVSDVLYWMPLPKLPNECVFILGED